ncbi:hypothetical protein [Streptomyces sp. NPDC049555]|uniref:hypothetical protein n=1 Tax=unclassified Streptomyces TaxID=2593676 RepID=UPI003415C3DE
MSPTTQWQRPAPLAVLLLLLAVVLAPLVGATAPGGGVPGGPATARAASAVRTPEAVPVADLRVDTSSPGGSCRQQDTPLGGVQAAVAAPHADPVTCPAGARGALAQDRVPRTGGVRAPPAPLAAVTGPLPVLRI